MHWKRDLVLTVTVTVILVGAAASAERLANTVPQSALSLPDFSGIWTKPYLGIEPTVCSIAASVSASAFGAI
jgi:hypothetical protein